MNPVGDGPTRDTSDTPPPAVPIAGEHRGQMVGPYKLLEILGEGGFGTVWLAERREPMVQRVALKIIKPGMDSKAVIARFEQERQALAVMDHPNVAKVFDGGVTEHGRPYFVMEHVQGEPITAYCDKHTLSIRDRLELFALVCDAVQHAHHKGIIHRDIKPSNILVAIKDGNAVPKVIDFGVAKAISHTLTEKTIFTEHGQLIGTPEYMSPEQAEMGSLDIDTRTDVYSLGVVLYELLSGVLPFESAMLRIAGYAEIQRIIREVDPPRPSTKLSTLDAAKGASIAKARQSARDKLASELKSELEWIPLKAMRKDRARRYASSESLATDVRRYLEGKPLHAAPESRAYLLRKFVRRNLLQVSAAAAVTIALVVGFGTALWQAREATRQRDGAVAATKIADRRTAEAEAERSKAEEERARANESRRAAEYESYVANLVAADASLAANEPSRVSASLDACPPSLRGWEWHWLHAQSDTSLLTLGGPENKIKRAAFSPDGTRIVTGSRDATVRVVDSRTGKELSVLRGHQGVVTGVAFSPDGHRVLTNSGGMWGDKSARIWNAANGEELAVLDGGEKGFNDAVFCPDGRRVATTADDARVRIWDAVSGAQTTAVGGNGKFAASPVFSPDGTRIAAFTGDGNVRVWHASSGEELLVIGGVGSYSPKVAYSADGSRLFAGGSTVSVAVVDAVSGEQIAVLRQNAMVRFVAHSPDGTRIVTTTNDGLAKVWEAATGREVSVLRGHQASVEAASFSPDGLRIVTASSDKTARLWDAASGKELAVLKGHNEGLHSAVFNPQGTRVLTVSMDETARVWDVEPAGQVSVLSPKTEMIDAVATTSVGLRCATVSFGVNVARVWDVVSGKEVAVLRGEGSSVGSSAFLSPDGKWFVTKTMRGKVTLWDVETSSRRVIDSGGGVGIAGVAFSPDSSKFAVIASSTVRVWDSITGEQAFEARGEIPPLSACSFNADASRLATVLDGCTVVFDLRTGQQLAKVCDDTMPPTSAVMSPDGTRVVTISLVGAAKMWDVASGEHKASFGKDDTLGVVFAQFNRDGTRLVTAESDGSAALWHGETGREIVTLRGHEASVLSSAFSQDGQRIVTGSADKTARIWDATNGRELAFLRGHEGAVSWVSFGKDGSDVLTWSRDDNSARVWTSIPFRERLPAIEAAQQAEARLSSVVETRLVAGESFSQIRASAMADRSISDFDREAYLSITASIESEQSRIAEAFWINGSLWNEVVSPSEESIGPGEPSIDGLRRVLVNRMAERLCELAEHDADALNTAGIAFVRANEYRKALESLTRAEELFVKAGEGAQPANWAFIAMAHWRLGERDQAREAAAKFRELAAQQRWSSDEEVQRWRREVDALILPE